ncbi:TIGR04139 family peptide modification target [Chryseobacterium sp. SN22]|uniref:TIGR04139 family peptide modification target n=1 Tax=Chryseobacterium sp. SN22 TaxID=2606431 RepID=UPI0011EF6E27|nr:TIGR04139 family peptide modification target [Chryseobacterium sp. SN22]KAA0126337.1 TIGR04139 family peptide modification target [Chryseobacterium sp. SN22]
MKKLTGMKKNFSSLENKRLKNLESVSGGSVGTPTNFYWYSDSLDNWNCKDIDTLVDGKWTQRQSCLTDDCDTNNVVTSQP